MNVKEELLKELADGEFVSGSVLAEKLGVSRNAVWKAVRLLESEGFVIECARQKGYRLSPDSNRLCAEIIEEATKGNTLCEKVIVFDEIDSTNSYAKELASKGAEHGTVIVADMQSGGRGRLGRSFVSPSGKGLYMTVIIRPDFGISEASLITSAAACAAAEAVERICGADVKIKWVNDIYINGKKICGILTEASFGLEMKSLDYAVIGIGVNVRSSGDSFDSELKKTASSIEEETGVRVDRNELCAAILNRLEMFLERIETRSFLNVYRRRELLTGNEITANVGNEKIQGKAVEIDDNANLVVITSEGRKLRLSSGEANLCRIVQ